MYDIHSNTIVVRYQYDRMYFGNNQHRVGNSLLILIAPIDFLWKRKVAGVIGDFSSFVNGCRSFRKLQYFSCGGEGRCNFPLSRRSI